jgi:hypothetical protein
MNHRSFRDLLLFDIAFGVDRNHALLRRLLKEHVTDDARQQLAKRVVDQLELSVFEIDEQERVMRKRDGGRGRLLRRLLLEQLQICPRTLQLPRRRRHRGGSIRRGENARCYRTPTNINECSLATRISIEPLIVLLARCRYGADTASGSVHCLRL